MTFEEALNATVELLKRRKRITYRAIKRQFALDDESLEKVKAEIIQKQQLGMDEGGDLLVWTGPSEITPNPHTEQSHQTDSSRPAQDSDQEGPSIQAERRQLTVMFCDLVGSTVLSESLDPEELLEVIHQYQKTCEKVIRQFDGTIKQFQGDGVLVYFGYPIAHEDDAQRGVQAALAILDELPNLNSRLHRICKVELRLRVGIHTGLVVVGGVANTKRRDALALGEAANLAPRIQDLTLPNTIVMSEATHALVKGFFDTQDLGEYNIKGVSRTIRLWQVFKKSGVQTRLEALGNRFTPLVGRESEIDFLLERWARIKNERGQTVMLKGEPGIGKTRLVEELKERIRHDDHRLQEYRCSTYYQNTALYPVINRLERWLHFEQKDSDDGKLRKLERTVQEHTFEPEEVALLASLLSVPLDKTYIPLEFTPETQRLRTFQVLLTLLLESSVHRPSLVIVEDLHWADPTTLELLTIVMSKVRRAKVLVVLTFRPEFEPPWSDQPNLDMIPLGRLSRTHVQAVAKGVAGGKALPREVTEQVVRRTDGVPLFIEELTKSLLESGLLQLRQHEYELARALPSATIPGTLQDSLMARLDRLSKAKSVAQLGATLGREFSYKLLQAVSPLTDATLQNELKRLEEAELLYREGLPPEARYIFKHALIQEVAYESLLKGTRREFHEHIAKVLENQFPSTTESAPELLAHHYSQAALAERAIPYWMRAGQRALKRSANPEAISHLTKGLELLKTLPESPERDQMELAIQLGLGPAYMITKGWGAAEVEESSTRAQALSRKLGDGQSLYAATWGMCFNSFLRGQLDDSLRTAGEVFRMAYRTDKPILQVGAHHAVGFSHYFRGEFTKSLEHAKKGLSLFEFEQERALVNLFQVSSTVAMHEFCGGSLWMLGYPDQAPKEIDEAINLAQKLKHPPSIALALCIGCIFNHAARDWEWVEESSLKAIKLSEKEIFLLWDTVAPMYHGWAIAMKGRMGEGIDEIEKGLEKFRATGTSITLPGVLAMLGEVLWRAGRIQEALDRLDEGMLEAVTRNEHFMEPELYRLKAEILKECAEGEAQPEKAASLLQQAEAYFLKAVKLSHEQNARMLEIRAVVGISRLWQQQGQQQKALKLLPRLYDGFTEGFDTADLREAKTLIEQLREAP